MSGQYFTTHPLLQNKLINFIKNTPLTIVLEPCVGRGDLVNAVLSAYPDAFFHAVEIDDSLPAISPLHIIADFLTLNDSRLSPSYSTILGNPPFVRTKKGNLAIDFTEKCFRLLSPGGELIFIVPSDFFKLTSASSLLHRMMQEGTFTHVFHPHNEKLFENANVDVILFRYEKRKNLPTYEVAFVDTLYNDIPKRIRETHGLITFHEKVTPTLISSSVPSILDPPLFRTFFHIFVGMATGKEKVYKHTELGNFDLLVAENKIEKYIFVENEFPIPQRPDINAHLTEHKDSLISRKIRKFNESNWFQWGAPRNYAQITNLLGRPCIYIYTLTRKEIVAFQSTVQYFGGNLILLVPKNDTIILANIVAYLNSDEFKKNFIFSGRFKIGHRQVTYTYLPSSSFTPSHNVP